MWHCQQGKRFWEEAFHLVIFLAGKQLFKGQSCLLQPSLGLCPVAGLPGLSKGNGSSRSHGREERWRRSRDGVVRSSVGC